MAENHAEYLGDGVYADFNGFHVELRVNDHRNPLAVALEDTVAIALIGYIERKFGLTRATEEVSEEIAEPYTHINETGDKVLDLMQALKDSLAKPSSTQATKENSDG